MTPAEEQIHRDLVAFGKSVLDSIEAGNLDPDRLDAHCKTAIAAYKATQVVVIEPTQEE